MVQLNPVPVFCAQKNTSTIWQKFSTEIFLQMVSAPDHQCEIASCNVRSTCSPVISLHLSYISYRQLANGPIRAASGAIVCWRSSLLFMYNVKRTPVVLSSATLNYIALHCSALRRCLAMYYTWLHCTALHNMRWRKSKLHREKCDVTKIQISEIMGLVACSEKKRRKKLPCHKSGCSWKLLVFTWRH